MLKTLFVLIGLWAGVACAQTYHCTVSEHYLDDEGGYMVMLENSHFVGRQFDVNVRSGDVVPNPLDSRQTTIIGTAGAKKVVVQSGLAGGTARFVWHSSTPMGHYEVMYLMIKTLDHDRKRFVFMQDTTILNGFCTFPLLPQQ